MNVVGLFTRRQASTIAALRVPRFEMYIVAQLLALGTMLPWPSAQPKAPSSMRCVEFATEDQLEAGASFTAPLDGELEFRLKGSERNGVWDIRVGPRNSPYDYLWIASPPFQTAPHLRIGSGYGLTAEQSVSMSPRRLRFVTSDDAFVRARAMYERARSQAPLGITATDFAALGEGTLELSITGFDVAGEELAWIRVKGRACQPR